MVRRARRASWRPRPGCPRASSTSCTATTATGRALVAAGDRRRRVHRLGRGRPRDRARAARAAAAARPLDRRDGRQEPGDRDDARRPRRAPPRASSRSALGLSGQKCSSCSRVVVDAPVHDELVEQLAARRGAARASATPPIRRRYTRARSSTPPRPRASTPRSPTRGATARSSPAATAPTGRPLRRSRRSSPACPRGHRAHARGAVPPVPHGHGASTRSTRRWPRPTPSTTGSPPASSARTPPSVERFLDEIEAGVVYVNRRAGATTGAWPGIQTFCGWKSSGSTGQGRARAVLPAAVHARAEPDRHGLLTAAPVAIMAWWQ